jgi:hypothetical protein
MKNVFLLISITILLFACKKEGRLDVRDFGKVSIDSISPGKGPSDVYITAYVKNFPYQESEIKVTLNDKQVTVVDVSKDTVLLYIPAGAVSGKLNFWFDRSDPSHEKYNYAQQLDSTYSFDYTIDESVVPVPIVKSATPEKGLPETVVTITGYNFSTRTGVLKVLFGATEAEILSINNTTITVKAPTLTPGTVPLEIKQGNASVTIGSFEIQEPPPLLAAVYWTNGGEISKTTFDKDGVPTTNSFFQTSFHTPTAVSTYNGSASSDSRIYWTTSFLNIFVFPIQIEVSVKRGELNGSQTITDLYPGTGNVNTYEMSDLDVGPGGNIYFVMMGGTNPSSHYIMRRNAGGSQTREIYELPNGPYPTGLKVDADGDMWWTELNNQRVMSGKAGGPAAQAPTVLFDDGDGIIFAKNIAIDKINGKIYIIDQGIAEPMIWVGNLDGTGALTKLPIPPADLTGVMYDIEIDAKNGYLYWMTAGAKPGLMRSKTDGTNVQFVMDTPWPGYFDILLP